MMIIIQRFIELMENIYKVVFDLLYLNNTIIHKRNYSYEEILVFQHFLLLTQDSP